MKRARAEVIKVYTIPEITLGEASFLPTIEAYTDTPIVHGNRIEILFNGDETFPAMLRDIKNARYTITFAQYLYKDGPIARDLAQRLGAIYHAVDVSDRPRGKAGLPFIKIRELCGPSFTRDQPEPVCGDRIRKSFAAQQRRDRISRRIRRGAGGRPATT